VLVPWTRRRWCSPSNCEARQQHATHSPPWKQTVVRSPAMVRLVTLMPVPAPGFGEHPVPGLRTWQLELWIWSCHRFMIAQEETRHRRFRHLVPPEVLRRCHICHFSDSWQLELNFIVHFIQKQGVTVDGDQGWVAVEWPTSSITGLLLYSQLPPTCMSEHTLETFSQPPLLFTGNSLLREEPTFGAPWQCITQVINAVYSPRCSICWKFRIWKF
jgi:hypothetical protein